MIKLCVSFITIVAALFAATFVGATYNDTFHPHAWLRPCVISKALGSTDRERSPGFPENLKWRVVDADTLFCENRRVRIYGIDAPEPEKRQAKCEKEIRLGLRATNFVRELLATSNWSTSRVGVKPGPDKYGRFLVHVIVGGRHLGALLKEQGLAKDWDGDGEKPDWCTPNG